MATAVFKYNSISISIPCKENDKMIKIINDFKNKINNHDDKILFFYYDKSINVDSTFEEIANDSDKLKKFMTINVYDNIESNNSPQFVESKFVICPICKINCEFTIEGNFITTSCNNNHKTKILITEYKKTQIIDISTIKCSNCNLSNKIESEIKGTFYYCCKCNENICYKCKPNHQKHTLIDYNNKISICSKHFDHYSSYCEDCKLDLCYLCETKHDKKHIIRQYKDKMVDKDKLSEQAINMKTTFDNFKLNMSNFLNCTEEMCKFLVERTENFEPINKNYLELQNINEIKKNIDKHENTIQLLNQIFNPLNESTFQESKKETIINEESFSNNNKKNEKSNITNINELFMGIEKIKSKNYSTELKDVNKNININLDNNDFLYDNEIKKEEKFQYINEENENIVIKKENKLCKYNDTVKNNNLFSFNYSQLLNPKNMQINEAYYTLINSIDLFNPKKNKDIQKSAFSNYFNEFTNNILRNNTRVGLNYIFRVKSPNFISLKTSKNIDINNNIPIFEVPFNECIELKNY